MIELVERFLRLAFRRRANPMDRLDRALQAELELARAKAGGPMKRSEFTTEIPDNGIPLGPGTTILSEPWVD